MAKKSKVKGDKRLAKLEKRAHDAVEAAQSAISEFVAELENRVMIAELMGQETESPEVNLLTEAAIAIHPRKVDGRKQPPTG
jgi:Sec-independent protein translocase protein TatA